MFGWMEEPESNWDQEMTVDSEECPNCGEFGEQTLYAGRRESLFTGTGECQECGHEWEISYENSPY